MTEAVISILEGIAIGGILLAIVLIAAMTIQYILEDSED